MNLHRGELVLRGILKFAYETDVKNWTLEEYKGKYHFQDSIKIINTVTSNEGTISSRYRIDGMGVYFPEENNNSSVIIKNTHSPIKRDSIFLSVILASMVMSIEAIPMEHFIATVDPEEKTIVSKRLRRKQYSNMSMFLSPMEYKSFQDSLKRQYKREFIDRCCKEVPVIEGLLKYLNHRFEHIEEFSVNDRLEDLKEIFMFMHRNHIDFSNVEDIWNATLIQDTMQS